MKNILTISFLLLFTSGISAQTLGGLITGINGAPIPYSTVYISELKLGTTANGKGEYKLNIRPGNYSIIYQSLGYSPEIKKVTISEEDKILNVVLQVQYYDIPEVRVTSSGEDPAYGIMRKAIGLAPYYLNQIRHYKAEVYIKGGMVIRKIPKIMKKRIEADEQNLKEGETYIIESLNEIEFNAPDRFDQRIISQHSTFPESGETEISPMDIVTASFYQPLLADIAISPLSPNAMAHYRFKYEGSTFQGDRVIDKISVIPRRKSQQVFEGTIFIVEDLWCLHSVDLVNENIAGSIEIKQIYTPVQDDIWMPVSHNFDINISIMGVKAGGTYGSAVTYTVVEPNTGLPVPEEILSAESHDEPSPEIIPEKSKDQARIEEILTKEELSNRDMVKLSRLMDKEDKKVDTTSSNLEIVEKTAVTVDENAGKRDSTYWNDVRPIPLSNEELLSLRTSDSLASHILRPAKGTVSDTTGPAQSSSGRFKNVIRGIATGHTFYSNDRSLSFKYGGIIKTDHFRFNTVDGFTYGTDFSLAKKWENGPALTISPEIDWAFAREKLLWRVNSTLTYSRMKQARLHLWFGRRSLDYNNSAGISPGLNTFTSLLFRNNYLKLYETRYITLVNRFELVNGFYVEMRYYHDNRSTLVNYSDFSLFSRDKEYTPNIPVNSYIHVPSISGDWYNPENHIHDAGRITLTYTPGQRYRINNGSKSPAGSDWPTFILSWEHGSNKAFGKPGQSYDLVRFEAGKSTNIGAFSEYSWKVRAGGFPDNRGIEFQDFVHFNSQPVPLLFANYQDAFMLPDYYSLATPEYFLEAHARITSPYILIKLLPFLSNTLIRENISFSYLYTPATRNYYEIGYALSEVFLLGRVGVYAGFNDLSFKGIALRFTFNIN